ncbi:MAG: cell division protein SepF [Pseudonocardia sp.]|nr:cell division protein SepF [Pseudonocardia sp.]
MSAFYRLKAYFGMVPPEDMEAYAEAYDNVGYDRYQHDRHDHAGRRGWRHADGPDREAEHLGERPGYGDSAPEPRSERVVATAADRRMSAEPAPVGASSTPATSARVGSRLGASVHGASAHGPSVHGALAVDAVSTALRGPSSVPELAETPSSFTTVALPMSRITTVHPRSYNEARMIGERYREGIPVIINLTELDDAAAKRLVDFAAGLAFALRGSIDKITSRVFLLSPAGVDVSAEDRRKLAERGFFSQD